LVAEYYSIQLEKIMADALIVDFHGPIAFRFATDWAWAYVPYCDDHTGNLLTDTEDVPLRTNATYVLAGPTPGQKTQIGGPPAVLVDWKETNGNIPQNKDCYCIFQLPRPDYIYGLRPEWVSITKVNGVVMEGKYARGLRFYYSNSKNPTMTYLAFHAACLPPAADVKYRIEINYRDTNNEVDPEDPYEDAGLCSKSMRKLFPPLDKWTVSFDPPKPAAAKLLRPKVHGIMTTPGPGGSDCGANGFVFNQGGL
jgi:hypothetical protein